MSETAGTRRSREAWGSLRRLPSKRWQARYSGPDGKTCSYLACRGGFANAADGEQGYQARGQVQRRAPEIVEFVLEPGRATQEGLATTAEPSGIDYCAFLAGLRPVWACKVSLWSMPRSAPWPLRCPDPNRDR
jgi:hypothetical protein